MNVAIVTLVHPVYCWKLEKHLYMYEYMDNIQWMIFFRKIGHLLLSLILFCAHFVFHFLTFRFILSFSSSSTTYHSTYACMWVNLYAMRTSIYWIFLLNIHIYIRFWNVENTKKPTMVCSIRVKTFHTSERKKKISIKNFTLRRQVYRWKIGK